MVQGLRAVSDRQIGQRTLVTFVLDVSHAMGAPADGDDGRGRSKLDVCVGFALQRVLDMVGARRVAEAHDRCCGGSVLSKSAC